VSGFVVRILRFALAGIVSLGHAAWGQEAPARDDARRLRPAEPVPVSPPELEAAVTRGVTFLIERQNEDGSFGSAERTKDLNIIAGVGSHHGFRAATTALCVRALIEVDDGTPRLAKAIERGEAWLLEELPRVRRDQPMLIYNVWAHAYGIEALVAMHGRARGDAARRGAIEEAIRAQFERLTRYEAAEGGWGYYDFHVGSQRPAADSTSFVNAAVLVAFHEAKAIGVEPPEKVTRRAIDATERQKLPDFSYLYGTYLRFEPRMGINRPGGSLGRSQACNLALRLWGDETVSDDVVRTWLDRLISRNGWLDLGRKRPIPHESHFQVAGYFYYFGHYYAARVLELLPPGDRNFYREHLARLMLDRQDADGSWWDYPLYNYHPFYGTAYAIMTLKRCRTTGEPQPSR
jgi:hypothetical protein